MAFTHLPGLLLMLFVLDVKDKHNFDWELFLAGCFAVKRGRPAHASNSIPRPNRRL